MINNSKKPLLYIGGGIVSSGAENLLSRLAKKNSIPVAATLMGLGSFRPDSPLYLGMLGMHAQTFTNQLVEEADLIVALGARFDDRATGQVRYFCNRAKIIHIDIDDAEIDKIKQAHFSLCADVKAALGALIPLVKKNKRADWRLEIEKKRKACPVFAPKDSLHPVNIIKAISSLVPPDAIITTDVGQHQMWVAQGYPFKKPRTLLTSGGLGTMGFGLPAAIGAALANPERKIVCISGDGSILMNIQELATLAELDLNITIIIMNNGHLGLVRQQQEFFYEKNYIASKFLTRHSFKKIAGAFGVKAFEISSKNRPDFLLRKALSQKAPSLVDIDIHYGHNVVPMVRPGKSNMDTIGGNTHE